MSGQDFNIIIILNWNNVLVINIETHLALRVKYI